MSDQKLNKEDLRRKMIYPQTLFQQLRHFPYRMYWEHGRITKYFVISIFLTLPLMYGLERLSYHPSNVKKYEDYLKREKEERERHLHSLEKYYGESHH